ncbi:Cell cycle checkpoint control protein RAD9B [Bagarius yarrelli]|uniref:Cell cycle checkpoint control protein RAD9B n=1 Tax=Bagarius yarrelli TaxID=175774 RepID=A0A556V582_BAGYA|nr:Cell cycle checkpoint control protein RAD9B [Bagarius yarrelli]
MFVCFQVFGKAVHALSRVGEEIWLDPLEKGSVMPLFRSFPILERSVYRCEITLNNLDSKVVFQFKCRNDCIMCTESFLHPDEFDYFHLKVDSNITFCLKELRGLLAFAEFHGLQLSLHFGSSGNPVSFSLEDMLLEAVVVLATLVDPASKNPSQVSVVQEAPAHSLRGVPLLSSPVAAKITDATVQPTVETVVEQVESSQGSLFFSPTYHVSKIMQLSAGEKNFSKSKPSLNDVSSGSAQTTVGTPDTSKICSLLFGAVTNDQNKSDKSEVPGLVYASDTEEEEDVGGDNNARKEGQRTSMDTTCVGKKT